MKKVIILSGVPGSGKSEFAAREYPDAVVCSSGHFYEMCEIKTASEARRRCLSKFIRLLINREKLIVVDNTNATFPDLYIYVETALSEGYDFEIIEFICDLNLAAWQNKQRISVTKIQAIEKKLKYRKLPTWWPRRVIDMRDEFES